jgi:hypothetical protein
LWIAAILLVAPAALLFADYDQAKSVQIMRANVQAVGKVRNGLGSDDFLTVSAGFAALGRGSQQMLAMAPPRGSEAEWDRIHSALVTAAFEGIIAAGNRDKAGAQAAFDKIGALNKEGHGLFK